MCFCTIFPFRGVCVHDRSTEPRSWDQGLLFVISPALCRHKKAMFLYSFLPGRGLSCPYPNPAPGNQQEETPFRSEQQLGAFSWGAVGGGARNLYHDSCKEERLPRNPALPFLCASIYSRDRKKKKYDCQQEFILQDLRTEA